MESLLYSRSLYGPQNRIGMQTVFIRLFVYCAVIQTVFVDGDYNGKLLD